MLSQLTLKNEMKPLILPWRWKYVTDLENKLIT